MRRVVPLVLALAACGSEETIGNLDGHTAWNQVPNNMVDVLWVVDNSCSMTEEQVTLASGFATFVAQMEASLTDFHIGVTTTSVSDDPNAGVLGVGVEEPDPVTGGAELQWLTNEDEYLAEFGERTAVGVGGSDKEMGLAAAAQALSPAMLFSGPNAGFLRPEAQLLVAIVSDEEDCSDGGALSGEPGEACYKEKELLVPVHELVEDITSAKDDPEDVQVSAIVGPENTDDCQDTYPGRRYWEAAALTGGLIGNICDGDWSHVMEDLGLNATGINTSFRLDEPGVKESLKVFVDDVEIEEDSVNGWTYDDATCFLTFHGTSVPPRESELHANYTKVSGGSSRDCEEGVAGTL